MITLWVEGYAATGNHGTAQCLGTFDVDTYEEAVLIWRDTEWEASRWGDFGWGSGVYSVWGCCIYDNEEDARKAFG